MLIFEISSDFYAINAILDVVYFHPPATIFKMVTVIAAMGFPQQLRLTVKF